jgi:hypothetical protein
MQPAESDSPLAPSASHLQRIRVRAYRLWESEGKPVGQSEAYWERARELDAIEHDAPLAIEDPVTKHPPQTSDGVLIEEASLQEDLGEFPTRFTDQGDTMPTPESREIAREFRDGESAVALGCG